MPQYREVKDTSTPERFFKMHHLMWAVLQNIGPYVPMRDMRKKWVKRGWKEVTRNANMLLFYDGKSPLPKAYFSRKDAPDPFMWTAPLDGHWLEELRRLVVKKR